jgi:exodeoxyribonuclease VII small subunit
MEKKFEDCMEELSSVVSQLQKEETPLEEMLVQYKKGTEAAMAFYIERNRERYT